MILPCIMSFLLLALMGWEAFLSSSQPPLHDEYLVDHLGMLLVAGQVPLILYAARRSLRRAASQAALLALVLGMIAAAEGHARHIVKARIEALQPLPGGERAIRAFLASAEPDGASSAIRRFLERDGGMLRLEMGGLGALRSVEFTGVDHIGWDSYAVTFEKGARHIHLYLNGDTRLIGLAIVDFASGCRSSEVYDCRYLNRPYRGIDVVDQAQKIP